MEQQLTHNSATFRIAIDARIINTSTGTYVSRLLEHLQDVDAENEYTILLRSADMNYWAPRAANFSTLEADFPNYSFAEQIGFCRLLNSHRFDLVHFCMPQQPVFYTGRRITTIHDLTLLKTVNRDKNPTVFRIKQAIGKHAFRSAAKKSELVLCPTDFTRAEIVSRWPEVATTTRVTYEAAEIEDSAMQSVSLPYSEYIFYIGSHSSYKNIERLVDAHQILLERSPELGLVFAGSNDRATDATREYVTRTNARNVHFLGRVSTAERNFLYSAAGAYVFPSLMEGFGLPGLEAMLWDTPVVSSSATCLPEVYADAAEYFDPLNSSDMARAIWSVLADPIRAEELISAGRARVREFSWRRMAEQTHSAYMMSLEL